MRNVFTGNVYHRNGRLLNRDFRILRRLVIHPDLRGCGQARRLVAETLPLVNTCYVECLAAMGAVNPIFERAGMIRLGQVSQQPIQQLGIDPLANDFEHHVASRPDVRQVVARTVHTWLRATTGRPVERIRRMTSRQLAAAYLQLMGTRPVYYLWSSNPQEMARLKTTTPGNEQNPR